MGGKLPIVAAVVLVAAFAGSSHAGVTVSTIDGTGPGVTGPLWNAQIGLYAWGPVASGHAPTMGQTFIPPPGNPVLQSITFEIAVSGVGQALPFQAYVSRWDGSALIDPPLFASTLQAIDSSAIFEPVTVNVPALLLTPDQQYAAYFSTIGDSDAISPIGIWGLMQTMDSYSGGMCVFNNGTTFPDLFAPTNLPWSNLGDGPDFAFAMDFTAVPEPSLLCVAGTIAMIVRRSKRSQYCGGRRFGM